MPPKFGLSIRNSSNIKVVSNVILNLESVTHDGKCRGEEVGYSADLVEDAETGKKSIVCTNKGGACRRNICECDKRLAEQFALHEDSWNQDLHTNKGTLSNAKSSFRKNRFSEALNDRNLENPILLKIGHC